MTIEGAYSGTARVVDHVPLGPAVVGSAVSNLGYGVTRLFEQVFTTPTLTEHGYVDALQVLATVRKTALSRLTTGDANSPTTGADVAQSWINYVADCVLYGVDRQINGASIDAILKATNMDAALQTPIVTGTTEIQLGTTRATPDLRRGIPAAAQLHHGLSSCPSSSRPWRPSSGPRRPRSTPG